MVKRNQVPLLAFGVGCLCILQTSLAGANQPEIRSVTADSSSNQIVVSGSNFGTGPNILLYDTFDSEMSASGQPLTKKASVKGEWSQFNEFNNPVFSSTGRSGSYSFQAFEGETQQTKQATLKFTGTQEFFVSYWIYLEGPDYFPGDYVSGPRTFSDDSSVKFLWVYDQDYKGNSSDVVLPTHVGYGKFYLAGNDGNLVTSITNEWWSWDNWMRLSFWFKANPENPVLPGIIQFDTLSADKGYTERTFNVPVFDEDGPSVKQYQQMNFPGWVRSIQSPSTNLLYDDIYVSVGPNSAARLELGNAPFLKDVTKLELLDIDSWSDTSIKASAPTVDIGNLQGLYLYLTGGDGTTNTQGIPLGNPPSQIELITVD